MLSSEGLRHTFDRVKVNRVRERAVAASLSTIYRLDAAGEVHEVVVEEGGEELQLDEAPILASSPSCAEERFDVNVWWAKQLGAALSAH
jgi:hypothetical protein